MRPIQTQLPLAVLLVRTVTVEATIGEQRSNVAIESYGLLGRAFTRQGQDAPPPIDPPMGRHVLGCQQQDTEAQDDAATEQTSVPQLWSQAGAGEGSSGGAQGLWSGSRGIIGVGSPGTVHSTSRAGRMGESAVRRPIER